MHIEERANAVPGAMEIVQPRLPQGTASERVQQRAWRLRIKDQLDTYITNLIHVIKLLHVIMSI